MFSVPSPTPRACARQPARPREGRGGGLDVIKRVAPYAIAGAALIALMIGGWLMWSGPSGRADPNDAEQVAAGARVYTQHCANCHGAKLEGQQPDWRTRLPNGRLPAPPHDEEGHTWHHPDDQLFRLTKLGLVPPLAPEDYESDMPAYKDILSDRDIWAVLAYIKSSWPARIRQRQQIMSERASQ